MRLRRGLVGGPGIHLHHPHDRIQAVEKSSTELPGRSAMLPDWRGDLFADLKLRGLPRERVLAVGRRLRDLGYFRAGGDQYAEENNSWGIATLMAEHVRLHSGSAELDYLAKSDVRRVLDIDDPDTVRAIRALSYRNGQGLSEIHGPRRIHGEGSARPARYRFGRRGIRRSRLRREVEQGAAMPDAAGQSHH